jgi:penicillin-binding protein 1C
LTGPPSLAGASERSLTVLDRNGRLLRAYTTADGRWRLPVERVALDQRYVRMLLAYEDGRFRQHPGVDPLAMGRSALLAVRHGRLVSGASTLTMQVARLLDGRHERTAAGKLRQSFRALVLERVLSKDAILDLYFELAPFGGNVEGVRAAALSYFGKEPQRLSVAEAALLVALPQSPAARRPDRRPEVARRARDRVVDRMVVAGIVSPAEAAQAKAEPVPTGRHEFPRLAPHLADAEVAADSAARVHRLTLDAHLQHAMEQLVAEHASRVGVQLSAAMLVVDHGSGEIRAHVGSPGYLAQDRFGAIDMTQALRSPGSTLKPFIYGLAFEAGLAHPETMIEDQPVRFGSYAPKNFDEAFHGTVTIREALQQSLNVPAVKVLAEVGPHALVGRFRRLDLVPALPQQTRPTLAIALGGIGFTLHDLATLYAALARGGEAVRLIHRQEERTAARTNPGRLLSEAAAWQVASILVGATPPPGARARQIAFKTGTSYGYRDAWAVGFDGRTTIAVWVGRPDGAATPGLTGLGAAAPLLFEAFQRLGRPVEPLKRPVAAAASPRDRSALAPPLRVFARAAEGRGAGDMTGTPVQIAFPPDRAEVEPEPGEQGEAARIVLKADGGLLPLTWLVDGKPIEAPAHARQTTFVPDGSGFVRVSVIDAAGRADHVTVRVR